MSTIANGCQRWLFFIYYRPLAVFHKHCNCYWRSFSDVDKRNATLFQIQWIISEWTWIEFSVTLHTDSTTITLSLPLPRIMRNLFMCLFIFAFLRNRHCTCSSHLTMELQLRVKEGWRRIRWVNQMETMEVMEKKTHVLLILGSLSISTRAWTGGGINIYQQTQ